MGRTTIGFGLALIVLGAAAYFGSSMASVTALIPAFFGIVIGICGMIALRPGPRTPALVVALVVALLGVAGSLSRLVPALTSDAGFTLDIKSGAQIALAIIAGAYVVLCAAWLAKGRKGQRVAIEE